jgi:hypothetical protein
MAGNPKARTLIHWALWSDNEEREYIPIGRTRFDASGCGQTKFQATPTSAWGWRCVTLPEGERPPELPPLRPRQTQPQPGPDPGEAEDAEPDDDGAILPGAR